MIAIPLVIIDGNIKSFHTEIDAFKRQIFKNINNILTDKRLGNQKKEYLTKLRNLSRYIITANPEKLANYQRNLI
jgi:hypothetical protein